VPGPSCPHKGCTGVLRKVRKDGRFYVHRGVYINVPASITIPRCSRCGKDSLSDELRDAVTQVLENEYQQHVDWIKDAFASVKEKK